MNPARPPRPRILLASAAIAGAILALAAFAPTGSALAADRPLAERPLPVIRVQGEGRVAVAPDMAIVTMSVVSEAETARAALDANNAAMAKVIDAMKAEGIEGKDLQTANFSIQPRYYHPPRASDGESEPPRIVGYTVSNELSVRVRDLARLGAILDKAVTLGINSGGNVAFTNAETDAIVEKARAAAMKDALARAQTLAAAAGVTLGPILEISENFSPPGPVPLARGRMMLEAKADAVPIETGESTYTVTVNASWEIVQ